jgi:hypothetical protein
MLVGRTHDWTSWPAMVPVPEDGTLLCSKALLLIMYNDSASWCGGHLYM